MDGKIKLDVFGKVIDINPEAYIVTLEKISDDCVSKVNTGQGGNIFTTPIFTVRDYGVTADQFIKEFDTQNHCAWADSQGISKRQPKLSDVEFNIIDSIIYKITEKGILYMENNPPKDSATSLLSRAELGKNHIQSQSLVDEIEFLLKYELIEPVK